MRIFFISLLFLILVGCANSNSTWHWLGPVSYYYDSYESYDSKVLAYQNRQQENTPSEMGG